MSNTLTERGALLGALLMGALVGCGSGAATSTTGGVGDTVVNGGPPTITITRLPAIGSATDLRGEVSGVKPEEHEVAVFIYVFGWYNKPYWAAPRTAIG